MYTHTHVFCLIFKCVYVSSQSPFNYHVHIHGMEQQTLQHMSGFAARARCRCIEERYCNNNKFRGKKK